MQPNATMPRASRIPVIAPRSGPDKKDDASAGAANAAAGAVGGATAAPGSTRAAAPQPPYSSASSAAAGAPAAGGAATTTAAPAVDGPPPSEEALVLSYLRRYGLGDSATHLQVDSAEPVQMLLPGGLRFAIILTRRRALAFQMTPSVGPSRTTVVLPSAAALVPLAPRRLLSPAPSLFSAVASAATAAIAVTFVAAMGVHPLPYFTLHGAPTMEIIIVSGKIVLRAVSVAFVSPGAKPAPSSVVPEIATVVRACIHVPPAFYGAAASPVFPRAAIRVEYLSSLLRSSERRRSSTSSPSFLRCSVSPSSLSRLISSSTFLAALENRSSTPPLLLSVGDHPSLSPSPYRLDGFPSCPISCSTFQHFEPAKCLLLDESCLRGCMVGSLPFASLADLNALSSTITMALATNGSMPLSSFDSSCCESPFGFAPMLFTLSDRCSGRAVPVQVVFALGKVPPMSMIAPRMLAFPLASICSGLRHYFVGSP